MAKTNSTAITTTIATPVPASVHTQVPFQRAPTTQLLVQFLRTAQVGVLMSYQSMIAIVQCNIQKGGRHFLDRAREILEKEDGIIFKCERDRGLVRLANAEIPGYSTEMHQSRLRNDTGKFKRKLDCVDTQTLTQQERQQYTMAIVHVGIRTALVNPSFNRQIHRELAQAPHQQIDRTQVIERLKHFG